MQVFNVIRSYYFPYKWWFKNRGAPSVYLNRKRITCDNHTSLSTRKRGQQPCWELSQSVFGFCKDYLALQLSVPAPAVVVKLEQCIWWFSTIELTCKRSKHLIWKESQCFSVFVYMNIPNVLLCIKVSTFFISFLQKAICLTYLFINLLLLFFNTST